MAQLVAPASWVSSSASPGTLPMSHRSPWITRIGLPKGRQSGSASAGSQDASEAGRTALVPAWARLPPPRTSGRGALRISSLRLMGRPPIQLSCRQRRQPQAPVARWVLRTRPVRSPSAAPVLPVHFKISNGGSDGKQT